MANCKTCGKSIPDGTEYCSECNALNKADESYLDSLLSSVSQNSSRPAKRKPASVRSTAAPVMPKFLASKAAKAESVKLEKAIEQELEKDFTTDFVSDSKQTSADQKPSESTEYDILSSSDDSYLDNLFSDSPDSLVSGLELDSDSKVDDIISDIFPEEPEIVVPETEIPDSVRIEDEIPAELADNTDGTGDSESMETSGSEYAEGNTEAETDFLDDLLSSVEPNTTEPADDPLAALSEAFALAEENENNSEASDSIPDDLFFSAPESDSESQNGEISAEPEIPDIPDASFEPEQNPETEKTSSGDTTADLLDELIAAGITDAPTPDISSLLDSDDSSENGGSKVSVSDEGEAKGDDTDILEFWSQLNGEGIPDGPEGQNPGEKTGGGDEQDELASLLAGFSGPEEDSSSEPIIDAPTISEEQEKINNKKPKKGFFARIFGNVRDELTPEQLEEKKQKALEKFEQDEEDAIAAKQHKAEKKAEDAEAAKAKKAEQAELKKKQAEEKKLKAQKKKEEKDKKEAARRALIEEIEENEGKINKIGASLVFTVFLGVLCFILLGTTIYTYKVSIQHAREDFERAQKPETENRPFYYDSAYQDIAGLSVKEEDQRLYDQIMTVSYINTQLLSYIRYSGLNMENEALDSLFKGLRRYETYISIAEELDVSEDLDYLRSELLSELSLNYSIDEETAYEILDIQTQPSYTQAINEIIENLNN